MEKQKGNKTDVFQGPSDSWTNLMIKVIVMYMRAYLVVDHTNKVTPRVLSNVPHRLQHHAVTRTYHMFQLVYHVGTHVTGF